MIKRAAFASLSLAAVTALQAHAQEGADAATKAGFHTAPTAHRLDSKLRVAFGITGGPTLGGSVKAAAANVSSEGS